CRLMNSPEARTRKQGDLLPLAQIELRACGKGVRPRSEGHLNCAWIAASRAHLRGVDSLAPLDRSRATHDAVAEGAEICAEGHPGLQSDAEIEVKTILREAASGADHRIESGIEGVTVYVRLLRHRRQAKE